MKCYVYPCVNHIFLNNVNNVTDLNNRDEIYFKEIKVYHCMTSIIKIEVIKNRKYFYLEKMIELIIM